MSNPPTNSGSEAAPTRHDEFQPASREEMQSALFAQLVMQQSGMATMLMGKSPHPETGQMTQDLEAARLFIDQLEMLQVKTRGNLNKMEQALLKQTLMALQMAFVEAVERPLPATQPKPAEPAGENKTAPAETTGAEESKKRFSKKFSL
jgi:hypothetical protein